MSCECNGNIDPSVPGSCNTSTGECLICTNNATGQQCEVCVEGFYGDATAQQCQGEHVDGYLCVVHIRMCTYVLAVMYVSDWMVDYMYVCNNTLLHS